MGYCYHQGAVWECGRRDVLEVSVFATKTGSDEVYLYHCAFRRGTEQNLWLGWGAGDLLLRF